MARYIIFLTLLLTFVGLSYAEQEQSLEKGVRFIIPIPVDMFSKDATISIRIFNIEQIERGQANIDNKCSHSFDMLDQVEVKSCPEGIKYLEVKPEKFQFPISTIDESIEVLSKTVKVGERYRLSVNGRANDNCNTTMATVETTAHSNTVTLSRGKYRDEITDKLVWGTTAIACY
jgi:hypothetical protein